MSCVRHIEKKPLPAREAAHCVMHQCAAEWPIGMVVEGCRMGGGQFFIVANLALGIECCDVQNGLAKACLQQCCSEWNNWLLDCEILTSAPTETPVYAVPPLQHLSR